MIVRLVLVKLTDAHATKAGRQAIAAHTRQVFAKLPDVQSFVVGTPADAPSEEAWDLCIQARFENMDRVEAYKIDPAHRTYVDVFLSPRAIVKKVWNFTV
jgi:hypothetical protein